jgi:hypothetical protein
MADGEREVKGAKKMSDVPFFTVQFQLPTVM